MFASSRSRRRPNAAPELDVAPLIDMVFILLIFFLVTTTFVTETGIRLDKPQAVYSRELDAAALRISIAPSGAVYTEGRRVDLASLAELIGAYRTREPAGAVILIPDVQTPAGRLVAVMDVAKAAGVDDIAVATRKEGGP